jgi:predicted MFS family arabinose efflux permease
MSAADASLRRRYLVTGIGAGTLGALAFALLPLLLGEYAAVLALDDAAVGWLGSTYVAGYTLTTGAAFLWVERVPWPVVHLVGAVLMVLGFGVGASSLTYETALVGFALAGAGSGLLFALSCALVACREDADRAFALKIFPEQGFPAVLLFILPVAVVAPFGIEGLLVFCAMLALLGAFAFRFTPRVPVSRLPAEGQAAATTGSGLPTAVALLGLLFFFCGFAGFWAFAEIILVEARVDKLAAGRLLAIGVVASAVGPLFTALVADYFGRQKPLLFLFGLIVIGLLLMSRASGVVAFTLLLALLPAAWYAGMAYQMGIVADVDLTGRFSVLMAAALGLGATLGPVLYGEIKAAEGLAAANGMAMLFAGLGIGCTIWAVRNAPPVSRRITGADVGSDPAD